MPPSIWYISNHYDAHITMEQLACIENYNVKYYKPLVQAEDRSVTWLLSAQNQNRQKRRKYWKNGV